MIAQRYYILAINTLEILHSEMSQRAVRAVLTRFLLDNHTSCGLKREVLQANSHLILGLAVVEVNIHIEYILLTHFEWQFLVELKLHCVVLLQFKSALHQFVNNVSLRVEQLQFHLVISLLLVEDLDFTLHLLRSGGNLICLKSLQSYLHVKHLTDSNVRQEEGTLVGILVYKGDIHFLSRIVGKINRILLPVAFESTRSTGNHLLVEHHVALALELCDHVSVEVVYLFVSSPNNYLELICESGLIALSLE